MSCLPVLQVLRSGTLPGLDFCSGGREEEEPSEAATWVWCQCLRFWVRGDADCEVEHLQLLFEEVEGQTRGAGYCRLASRALLFYVQHPMSFVCS